MKSAISSLGSIYFFCAGLFVYFLSASLKAQPITDTTLAAINIEQKLDSQLSLDSSFQDENGHPIRLGQYFENQPVILILGYYRCPMLCGLVLNGLVECLEDLKWSVDRDFQIVNVSIDPRETPALAAGKKRNYLKRYGRSGSEQGWHFLTGSEPAIRQLAEEVGFKYIYDAGSKQYAHPSGLIIVTPKGKVSSYLFGATYSPTELYSALKTASVQKTGARIRQLALLCFHYNPITGKYGPTILLGIRALGILTLASLGWLILRQTRHGRRSAWNTAMVFPIFPDAASKVARQTDYLFWALLLLSLAVCLLVFGLIIVFLFKYRIGKAADRRPLRLPEFKIEATWTIVPTLLMMGFFVWGAEQYFTLERSPSDGMEINVVGKQWMWKVQHPEGVREINELHVPAGSNVRLTLASQDVIHSFYLPAFRIKQDVVPGRYTQEWFKADKPGSYHLFCSEYCGTSHSRMVGRVVVMSPADYQEWLTRGNGGPTLAQSGERLYRELGCSGCHTGISVVRAPPLEGLFGKPVPLESGEVVMADEGYLRDSILLPGKQVASGYTNAMPSFAGHVSEEELLELIAYIKSRASKSPGSEVSP